MNKPGSYLSYPGGGFRRGCIGVDGVVSTGVHSGLVALPGSRSWGGDRYPSALSGVRGGLAGDSIGAPGVRGMILTKDRCGRRDETSPVHEGSLAVGVWEMSEERL
jgi:hypothetical protein